jgi:hypothetical protein
MALTNSYVQVYGQIPSFLRAIQDAQAPERFTQRYLKDLGFNSANHRALIPLLKALGFLSADGTPTPTYLAFRDRSQGRRVLGDALRSAYGDLFTIKANPTESDRPLIEGKFKSVHNCSDRLAKLMANTFFALLENADLEPPKSPPKPPPPKVDEPPKKDKPDSGAGPGTVIPPPGLHYNIQIHLPATKDIEVYNAIFKSLREHLLG